MRRASLTSASLALIIAGALAATPSTAAEGAGVVVRLTRALESRDASALGEMFPSDRKVRVSLHRIAELEGFAGSGPLVEAFRRYFESRPEIHFDAESPESSDTESGSIEVRGILTSRDRSGRREKIGLVFSLTRIEGHRRIVEVREAG